MRKPGLVSITFRNKTPHEIILLMNKAQLSAVEWGGDVHVPPKGGRAANVRQMSKDAGIDICSYGSYFRLGQGTDAFRYALDEASELGAPVIRIWAGSKPSDTLGEREREALINELLTISALSKFRGIETALEFHGNTMTDSITSAEKLLLETDKAKAQPLFYWQPRWDWTEEARLASLSMLGDRLSHIHVFTWKHENEKIIRLPLSDGEKMWKRVLSEKKNGYALIEFVRDDSDESLMEDARTLNRWLENTDTEGGV